MYAKIPPFLHIVVESNWDFLRSLIHTSSYCGPVPHCKYTSPTIRCTSLWPCATLYCTAVVRKEISMKRVMTVTIDLLPNEQPDPLEAVDNIITKLKGG